MSRVGLALVCALAVIGCIERDVVECDGRICPGDAICEPIHDVCVLAGQLTACDGLDDGASCEIDNRPGAGRCDQGVCLRGTCGDGVVDTAEDCDGGALGARPSCRDHGFHDDVGVGCDALCAYDTSACGARCGDGELDGGEACDGDALDGQSCTDFGFYAGSLACSGACTFDVSGCTSSCGDGVLDPGEQCEPGLPIADDCTAVGFYQGSLGCSGACAYDASGCSERCGDGELNGAEACDGAPPAGVTCLDFGYDFGRIACSDRCAPDVGGCGVIGWTAMASPDNADLYSVFGTGPDDVHAVGSGVILHYDGVSWTAALVDEDQEFSGVWGSGPDDVYAVGNYSQVWHSDGAGWSHLVDLTVAPNAVWGSGPDDVVAVGGGSGFAARWDGVTWTELPAAGTGYLMSVWSTSASDVWASDFDGAMHHFDGTTWTSTTVSTSLTAVHGVGDEVYALDRYQQVVWRYDAGAWTAEPLAGDARFGGIAGTAEDLWIVGSLGSIQHRNGGGTWSATASTLGRDFADVWGTAGDLFAVGDNGLIAHSDGADWVDVPPLSQVASIAGITADELYAAGTLPARFDGGAWSVLGTSDDLVDVWVAPTGEAYAIGGSKAWTWDGAAWRVEQLPSVAATVTGDDDRVYTSGPRLQVRIDGAWSNLGGNAPAYQRDVWLAPGLFTYAVGDGGSIARLGAVGWTALPSGTTATLRGVWGPAADLGWAVGDGGVIVEFDGASWTPIASPTTSDLYGIWGSAAGDVFAVGEGGTILHRDATTWSVMTSPVATDLYGVWGRAADDVIAVGADGVAVTYAGAAWTTTSTGVTAALRGVGGDASSAVAVGDDGTIVRRTGGAWTRELGDVGATQKVFALASDDVYFLGVNALYHHDGTATVAVPGPPSSFYYDVWGTAANDLYVTGVEGGSARVHHFDGATWSTTTLASGSPYDLWGASDDLYVAVEPQGVYHFDGSTWSLAHAGAYRAGWGSGDDVVVVGHLGVLATWDGATWTDASLPSSSLVSVWGRAPDDLYVGGSLGALWHFDGATWAPIRSGVVSPIDVLWGTPGDLFFLADYDVRHIAGRL